MQVSLRSQMIAGATALVGSAAVAITPIAPTGSLPAVSVGVANVALSAWESPIVAVLDTIDVGVSYLINNNYSTGTDGAYYNWGYESGITDDVNDGILPYSCWDDGAGNCESGVGYLPYITNVGLISNFISVPFPIASQVLKNWLGYGGIAWQAARTAVEGFSSVVWAPVELTAAVVNAVISGQIATIPTLIQEAVGQVVTGVTDAFNAVVEGATRIVQDVVAKAQAVVQVLASAVPSALANTVAQISTLATTAQTVFSNIATELVSGDVNGAWNAAVVGLLSPGNDGSVTIPGDLLNLTLGAGIQLGDVTDPASYQANFVPSIRNELQSLGQGLSIALESYVPPAAASVRSAAARTVKTPAAAAVAANTAVAAAAPAKKAPVKASRRAAAAKAAGTK